jgi:P27 family predicted phage terminase small subunit
METTSNLFGDVSQQGLVYDIPERKYKALKAAIKKYLTNKGLFEKLDMTLIEELVFNIRIADQARADIAERGIQVNVRASRSSPLFQTNQSVSIYQTACKQITSISNRLALSVDTREKLGLKSDPQSEEGDDLDEFA